MAALFYLFFTDVSLQVRKNYLCFSSCGGNGVILPLLVLLLKTAGNIDSIMLAKASQRKFRY
jgi:hypothetical protein